MKYWLIRSCTLLALSGCDWSLQRMLQQARCESDEATPWLNGGHCNQAPPEGVVPFNLTTEAPGSARAQNPEAEATPAADAIRKMSRAQLERGQERFEVMCGACHGLLGNGKSQVAENMVFRPPPSLHEPSIVEKSDAHMLQVISDGYGLMPSYAHVLTESERWAVVAYLRVLQHSQDAALDDLPASVREEAAPWLH